MIVEKKLVEVEAGAVLAADVLDAHGEVLLAKGTGLTSSHLQLLRRRGVESVSVYSEDELPPRPGELLAAQLAAYLERQERVFSKVRGDPRMAALYQAARAHLAGGNLPPS
jgi:hypothetical protein